MTTTSPRTWKAALLGAGHIAEFHAKAVARHKNARLVGIADFDLDRAAALAAQFDAPPHVASLKELLQLEPDVVHILTPPSAHASCAVEALEAGCHVVVEKPLATSTEDCDRIEAAARANDRLVCVGHSLLRDPFVVRAAEMVRSGAIGQVVAVDHLRGQHYPHYQGGPVPEMFREGGFPFRDIGVHSLYLLEEFLGPVEHLDVRLGSLETDGNPRIQQWRVLADCQRGLGQIYLTWTVNPLQNMLIIHGTRGVIRADIFGMSVTARRSGKLPGHAERIANSMGEGARTITQVAGNVLRVLRKKLLQYHGLQDLVGEFYDCLSAGRPAPVGIEAGRSAVRWTEHVALQADEAKRRYVAAFATSGAAEVLLTGATGFIGRHLLRRLLERDQRVRILVRRWPAPEIRDNPQVEVFLGDLGDPDSVDRAMAGIRQVYHLGAAVEGEPEDFQCATLAGTRNIIESCLKHGIQKIIYMSSLSVIDARSAARSRTPVTENFPFEPHPERRGHYTQTKLQAERMVTEAVQTRHLPAVILRPGEVLGPDKLFLSGAVGREAGVRVVVLGGGRSIVPLIWVDDLVDAILAAAASDHFDGTAFNLVDPEEVTQDELARHYLQALGRRPRLLHFPLFALYPAALGLQLALGLLGKQSPITPYRLSSALGSRRFDCTAAHEKLGWQPRTGIRAGLAAILEHDKQPTRLTPSPTGCAQEPAEVS
jgi:predicted dehydrogenase/nucleoside-diphosphate-sugar epimerase